MTSSNYTPVDFHVAREGINLVLITPVSPEADTYAEHAFAAAMRWGASFVVETRYAADILHDLINQDYVCSFEGRVLQ